MLYNALVRPYFTYCSTVWHQGNLTHIDKLKKLQNRAARIITNANYEIRSVDILNKLRWEPIKRTLNHQEKLMTFKALRNMTPKYISDLFHICQKDNYGLRSNDRKLSLPKPKTNFLKKSFSYRGAQAWNSLPEEIVDDFENLSVPTFKRLLRAL